MDAAQATEAPVSPVPERDSLAFVATVWRAMAYDLRVRFARLHRDRHGRRILAGEGPHEIVSQYLVSATWERWIAVLDRLSDVELAMLSQIASHNGQEVKERHRSLALMATGFVSAVAGLAQLRDWLDWIEPQHLSVFAGAIFFAGAFSLQLRLKTEELDRLVKLAEARRRALGGPSGELDVEALWSSLPPLGPPGRRLMIQLIAASLGFTLIGGLILALLFVP